MHEAWKSPPQNARGVEIAQSKMHEALTSPTQNARGGMREIENRQLKMHEAWKSSTQNARGVEIDNKSTQNWQQINTELKINQ
jgi:hypothetical protein